MTPQLPPVSMRLVDAVATYTDTDPLELPPLYDTIDPDALDRCVARMEGVTVSFEYASVSVSVESSGVIRLGERSGPVSIRETDGSGAQTGE